MDILNFLLENGAKFDTRDETGKTLLHIGKIFIPGLRSDRYSNLFLKLQFLEIMIWSSFLLKKE